MLDFDNPLIATADREAAVPGWSAVRRDTEAGYVAAYLENGGLEREWRAAFGFDIKASVAMSPAPVDLLSPGELACYRNLPDPESARYWLTGRAALKRLLRRLDLAQDTARPGFPYAGICLAQSGGVAMAVAAASVGHGSDGAAPRIGLAMEIENNRPLRLDTADLFLSPEERDTLFALGDGRDRAFLRAWTVKQAIRKAEPESRRRAPAEYRLGNSAARSGTAARADKTTHRFRYLSHRVAAWHICLAAPLA